MSTKRKKFHFLRYGILAPSCIWLIVFLVIPYFNLFLYSFWKNGAFKIEKTFTLNNYIRFFAGDSSGSGHVMILLQTLRTSLIVTVIAIIISFPLAYFIIYAVKKARSKKILYMMTIIPLWVSYSDASVIIAMVHIYTPYVMMPIYTSLEQIPQSLIEASRDLGCGGARTLGKIIIPLSLPGIVTGATYAFALSMGDFLAPSLLGGTTSSTKIANIVQMQFGTSDNWPYGAAIGMIILVFVIVLMKITGKIEKHYANLNG